MRETVSYELHILVPVLKDCLSFYLYPFSSYLSRPGLLDSFPPILCVYSLKEVVTSIEFIIYGRSCALQKQCSLILIKFSWASSCIRWVSGEYNSASNTISGSHHQETIP